ncbi:MAG: PilW family protein [Gammaproteobacteria bacterium]|nr:PilW family protein [Gammaproteobacteria bacterium]
MARTWRSTPLRWWCFCIGRGASGESALFRRSYAGGGGGDTQEIVEGVENMQILYGEDTTGDRLVDIYRTSDTVVSWADVVAARVGLLLRTVESGRQENDTAIYDVLGTNVTPPAVDARRHRRVFTTTIALRNRVG